MASFDKEKFKARLEKMSTDEIRENLPNFRGKKKSAALNELTARGRDQELKSQSTRKETAQWKGVIVAAVIAACTLIALIILTAALLLSGL